MQILAQFYGVVLLVVSLACLLRAQAIAGSMKRLAYRPNMLFAIGVIEFIIGTALVLLHSHWTSLQAVLISIIHWELVLEGLLLLFLPQQMCRLLKYVKSKQIVQASSIIMLAVGVLLAGFGFEIIG